MPGLSPFIRRYYVLYFFYISFRFPETATQVKWNRRNSHLLASSHAGEVLVWDERVSDPYAPQLNIVSQ